MSEKMDPIEQVIEKMRRASRVLATRGFRPDVNWFRGRLEELANELQHEYIAFLGSARVDRDPIEQHIQELRRRVCLRAVQFCCRTVTAEIADWCEGCLCHQSADELDALLGSARLCTHEVKWIGELPAKRCHKCGFNFFDSDVRQPQEETTRHKL